MTRADVDGATRRLRAAGTAIGGCRAPAATAPWRDPASARHRRDHRTGLPTSPAGATRGVFGLMNPFGQAEEIRDVIGRGNSRLDQERALRAVAFVIVGDAERRAMGHVGDGVGFDDGFAIGIPPDLARIAVDDAFRHRRRRQVMHVEPLLDDLVGIGRVDGAIGAAMPHRKLRPRAFVLRGIAHQVAQFGRRARWRLEHAVQRFAHIAGDAKRQAGDHGAGREQLGIGGEHHRRHGAAGGKSGDENAARIDPVVADHPRDHLPDRTGLAAAARGVFRIEPVEAAIGVVRRLLLRHQQREPIVFCQRRPAGAEIVGRPRSDRSHAARRPARGVAAGAPGTSENIRSSPGLVPKPVISTSGLCGPDPSVDGRMPKAVDSVQLWQMSQEFDIVGKGHRQLLR